VNNDNAAELARRFFPGTAASYDSVVRVFTLGLDTYWKWRMVGLVRTASRVLDLACGTGMVTMRVHNKFPKAEFVGVDLTADYLEMYKKRTAEHGISAKTILADAEKVPLEGVFDLVISSYLPKYVDPDRLLSNVAPHVALRGMIVLHDFTLPPRALWRRLWHRYNAAMNWIGFRLMPSWREVFNGELTHLIERTDWWTAFSKALPRYGFQSVTARYLSVGCAGLITALKSES
jgi:demethylmenaquinone methyltransferase/2-methoxy-6-polyprenyl-1,4-benzoquinol methylase